VRVRVLVDGRETVSTPALQRDMTEGGIEPSIAQRWRRGSSLHRLRRRNRKLCQVDGRVVRRWHQRHRRHEHPHQAAARRFLPCASRQAAAIDKPCSAWALCSLCNPVRATCVVPDAVTSRASARRCKFVARDNLRHRRDIEHAYLAAIRTAKSDITIANSYFFPGIRFRRALVTAAERGVTVTLLLQAKVEYLLLHFASRAMYGQLLQAGIIIQSITAACCTPRLPWSTIAGPRSARRTSIPTAC
jgi:cardiolipin synthase